MNKRSGRCSIKASATFCFFQSDRTILTCYLEQEKEIQLPLVNIASRIGSTVKPELLRCVVIGRMADRINFRF